MAEEKRFISVFFVILQSLIYTVFAMDERLDKVKVQCDYLPLINFAIQQNGASIIHQLSIENTTPAPLKDIQVQITTEPTFGNAAPIAVAQIPPNESICLSSFNLTLSANYFTQLTERLSGNLKIEITSEAESVFCQTYPIDILAYDQWGGLNVLPEMLAAFITPNHTAIVPIIKRAASILGQWTDNPSLDEYQSRTPDRVRKQMAAIYTAITEQQIIYSTIPASFEEYGQRVRLADSVMAQKLGTCLDMALLYASCLEAIGLNALIIITQGHAFAGAWLVPETFPDPTIDDVSLLTKRTAEGIYDITLVETTCMNMGHSSDFDDAVKKANGKLTDGNSFDIFEQIQVTTPVIFTTAYDEHAIQAFKVNSVDYLLKPVEEDDLLAALRKFEQFRVVQSPVTNYRKLEEALMSNCKKNRFLIQKGDAYHYVETSDIAFFYSEEKVVFLHTFSDKRYIVDYTLEQIEQLLDERTFFRVSRNCIANINSIRKISKYFNSRLKLSFQPECPHEVLISRVRVPDFLKWVDGVL